jgi:hypothetical protein
MSCDALSDRMPLVASGQAVWSEEERRHLEGCADCAAEWRLVEQAAGVGRVLPGIDARGISTRVLHRLATEPVRPIRSGQWWLARAGVAAAAAATLLVVLRPGGSTTGQADLESAFEIPMTELDSLSHEQLRLVLESIEEPLETPMMNEIPSMLDLDDQQLERVLRSLEG